MFEYAGHNESSIILELLNMLYRCMDAAVLTYMVKRIRKCYKALAVRTYATGLENREWFLTEEVEKMWYSGVVFQRKIKRSSYKLFGEVKRCLQQPLSSYV